MSPVLHLTSSVPVRYADDMAAACPSKFNLDRIIYMAYQHGCTWRYEFNGEKSAVLVLGENKNERDLISKFRQFSLGGQKIPEKIRYEHLGTVSTVYEENSHRVGDRLSKARRVLNAATGVGIRGKGLNMYTCNIICWCIVVPTALFGCEIWCLTANDISDIGDFQVYADKKNSKTPSKDT